MTSRRIVRETDSRAKGRRKRIEAAASVAPAPVVKPVVKNQVTKKKTKG